MRPKKLKRGENYVKHTRDLIESPAWRALSLAARHVLDRLEIELLKNAGTNNGKLICTFDDFEQFNIRRKAVAPAIRLLVKVGLVEITQRGWRAARHGRPARYRLPYLPAYRKPPTDEWRQFTPEKKYSGAKTPLHHVGAKTPLHPGAKTPLHGSPIPGGENATTFYNSSQSSPRKNNGPGADAPHSTPESDDVEDIPEFLRRRPPGSASDC